LAGVLGGAAEAHYALSRKVNLDSTLNLLESLRDEARPPRLIFASSIAVFGPPLPQAIDDDTLPMPVMHYGGQKRMIEVALEQLSAHGWIDGIALRLPGIIARADASSGLKSAFLNTLFYDYAAGKDFTLPVSAEGTVWLLSVGACVQAFVHAAELRPGQLQQRRAFTLPAIRVSMAQLLRALAEQFPESRSQVAWDPDPQLEALFARQPPLSTAMADALGFRHDGSLRQLIAQALTQ
jgi:nucleoside-diphosphate-sugar epimerase